MANTISPGEAFKQGVSCFLKADYAHALENFNACLKGDPNHEDAFLYKMRCLRESESCDRIDAEVEINKEYRTRLNHSPSIAIYSRYFEFLLTSALSAKKDLLDIGIKGALQAYPHNPEMQAMVSSALYRIAGEDRRIRDRSNTHMLHATRMEYANLDFLIQNFQGRLLEPVKAFQGEVVPLVAAFLENKGENAGKADFCAKALDFCLEQDCTEFNLMDFFSQNLGELDESNPVLNR